MAKWINADGLQVRFGKEEGVNKGAGEYNVLGPQHITEVTLELADCPATAGIISDTVSIPAGVFIEKVQVLVTTETTGTNANLDLGLAYQHATTGAQTELDYNGLLAAADAFNGGTDLGATYTYQVLDGTLTTEGGALIGTTLASTNSRYLLTCNYDTAAFTAGVVVIRVYWSKVPTKTDTIP